jgi:hypothetical protein
MTAFHMWSYAVQVQIAALRTLPLLPAYLIGSALLEGELGTRLLTCLANSAKEVRRSARARSTGILDLTVFPWLEPWAVLAPCQNAHGMISLAAASAYVS